MSHVARCVMLVMATSAMVMRAGTADGAQTATLAAPQSRWAGAGAASSATTSRSSTQTLVESGASDYRRDDYAPLPVEREMAGLKGNVVGPLHGSSKSFVAPRYRLSGKPTDGLGVGMNLTPSW